MREKVYAHTFLDDYSFVVSGPVQTILYKDIRKAASMTTK